MRLIADLPLAGQTMVCRIVLEHRGMHVPSYGLQETESVHWYRKEYGAFQKPEVFHIPDDRSLDRDSFCGGVVQMEEHHKKRPLTMFFPPRFDISYATARYRYIQ